MARMAARLACIVVALAVSAPVSAQPKSDPTKAEMHADRARAARDAEQWNAAAAEYKKAYEYDAKPKYLFNIGLSYDLAGKQQEALVAFRAYVASDPNGKYVTTARAKIDELEKKIEKERQRASAAKIAAHLQSARKYHDDGRHDAAAFEYEKAYELTNNTDYLFESAESHRRIGSNDRAVAAYQAYMQADASGKFSVSAQRHIDALENKTVAPDTAKRPPTPVVVAPVEAKPVDKQPAKKKKKSNKWIWYVVGGVVVLAVIGVIVSSGGDDDPYYYYSIGAPDFRPAPVVPAGLYGR